MEYILIREEIMPNGLVLQIVKTNECGGRYYMVTNGQLGFHSLDFDRVNDYVDSIVKMFDQDRGQSR